MENSKKVGMYFETPEIKVGKYSIYEMSITTDGNGNETLGESVWIQLEDHEGAEFKKDLFEKYLDDFFNKNF